MKPFWLNFFPPVYWNTPGEPGGAPGGTPPGGAPGGTPPGGAPGGTPPGGAPGGAPGGNDPAGNFPTLKPGQYNDPNNPGNGNNPDPKDKQPGGENNPPSYIGAPEGGKYADFTAPKDFTIDNALVGKFAPIAAKLGLSQVGAQELVNFYAQEVVGPQSAAFVDQIATWFGETEKDAEIGGAKFEASTQAAGRALQVFGTKGLRSLLVEYGLGNHPEVVRFFTRVGNAIGEDKGGGQGNPAAGEKDFLTLMYGPNPKAGQR